MKAKYVIILSVCALLLLAVLQALGTAYAYRSQMRQTEATLATVFKNAFILTVDAQVNRLPYPEGTITHLVYAPDSLHLNDEDRQLHYAEQTSVVMQEGYGQPEIALDSLCRQLTVLLRHEQVEGSVFIRKFDARTGRTLATAPAEAFFAPGIGIGIATSPRAFIHPTKGLAVEAILDVHYFSHPSNLLFPGLTLLLALLLVGAIVLRLRLLRRLQHDIDRQCADYYRLAEQMAPPIRQMEADLQAARWTPAGETARQVLADTEAVLTRAKQENARQHACRTRWLDRLSWGLMPLALLLPALWGAFVYHEQAKALSHTAEVALERAFMEENDLRYQQSIDANHLRGTVKSWYTGETDYYKRQADSLLQHVFYRKIVNEKGDTVYQTRASFHLNPIYVLHQTMNLSEGIRLYRAYGTQQQVNSQPVVVPVDTLRLDSLFRVELQQAGLPTVAGLRILRPATGDVVTQTGDATPRPGSLVTAPLRLDEEGTVCVQGVVPHPQSYIFRSAWYLYVPLGLTLAFCLLCIAGLWRVWKRQRRLEQFRKDFTYSMIHDMKSPLQSLLMGTQVMASGKLNDKPEKAARIRAAMDEECTHLRTLSARVVTLTQVDRGTLQLHLTAIPLRPLFEDLAAKFRLKATKPVTFDIDCTEHLTARADAFCLREVLSNLIDNALKYSRREVHIRLSAAPTAHGGTCIRVHDNGIGIPPSERKKIFDRFQRISAGSRRTGVSGFGLGLNFVRQVVQAHGGTVTVESDGSSFSEFTVVLPGQDNA